MNAFWQKQGLYMSDSNAAASFSCRNGRQSQPLLWNVSIWIGGRLLQAHMDGQVWSTLPEGLNKYLFQKASV